IFSDVTAVIAAGTSCSFSARLLAVTMISLPSTISEPGALSCAAANWGMASAIAAQEVKMTHFRCIVNLPDDDSFLCDLSRYFMQNCPLLFERLQPRFFASLLQLIPFHGANQRCTKMQRPSCRRD